MLRHFGLIGDVHQEDAALAEILDSLRGLRPDVILCTGDVVDGRGDASRCCALLQQAGVVTVRGNHDRWCLGDTMRELADAVRFTALEPAAQRWLAALPPTVEMETAAGRLLLCHGLGDDDMARLLPDDEGYALQVNTALHRVLRDEPAVTVFGHTHRRMVGRFGQTWFVNPGTLIHDRDPGFMLLDLVRGVAERRAVDGQLIETTPLPEWR